MCYYFVHEPSKYNHLSKLAYRKSEKVLKENGIKFKNKKLFFKTNAKAKIKGDDSGFIKVLYDEERSLILGASIIGNHAAESYISF